jgi:hypothetical protein
MKEAVCGANAQWDTGLFAPFGDYLIREKVQHDIVLAKHFAACLIVALLEFFK